jgi:hypothetical protein
MTKEQTMALSLLASLQDFGIPISWSLVERSYHLRGLTKQDCFHVKKVLIHNKMIQLKPHNFVELTEYGNRYITKINNVLKADAAIRN